MAIRLVDLPKRSAFRLVVDSKGSILIIALWSLCLLSVFAVILSYGVRQKAMLVSRLEERGKLHFITEAGIKKAIVDLKNEEKKTYDWMGDPWSSNEGAFKEQRIGGGIIDICYNYRDDKAKVSETRYGLIDEERKININKADRVILEHLFQIALNLDEVEAQQLGASIVDWRDSDSELSIPLGSAEDSYYRNLPYAYEAKDADFEVLDELLLVKGMTGDIFERMKEYITVYGNGKVNINTASKEVLLALGLNEKIADGIVSFRCGKDEMIGTADDNIFDVSSNIVPKLSQFTNLSDYEITQLTAVSERDLATNSDNFMVRIVARLNNKKRTTDARGVINRDGKVLYWRANP